MKTIHPLSIRILLFPVFILLPLALVADVRPKDEKASRAEKGAVFLPLPKVLEKCRAEYRPFLVYYGGGAGYKSPEGQAPEGDLPGAWKSYLAQSRFEQALKQLPACQLEDDDLAAAYAAEKTAPGKDQPEKSDPKKGEAEKDGVDRKEPGDKKEPAGEKKEAVAKDDTAAARLGLVRGVPAVILVDFRERVAHRFTGKLPLLSALQRQIQVFAEQNKRQAAVAREVDKILEKSRYAWELKDTKAAVQHLQPLEDPKERKKLDAVSLEQVTALSEKYRAEAEKIFRKADELVGQKKYEEAMRALEQIAQKYPFTDLIRRANQKRGEIYRKAQYGG
ncbi:MAG: hypothetical protein HY717_01095 [Planctomycetes bacterium]|nr:hypothetical protein [Planctomycetota bacterium]